MGRPTDFEVPDELAGDLILYLGMLAASALANLRPDVRATLLQNVARYGSAETMEVVGIGNHLIAMLTAELLQQNGEVCDE